jgi:hypothetical protein
MPAAVGLASLALISLYRMPHEVLWQIPEPPVTPLLAGHRALLPMMSCSRFCQHGAWLLL